MRSRPGRSSNRWSASSTTGRGTLRWSSRCVVRPEAWRSPAGSTPGSASLIRTRWLVASLMRRFGIASPSALTRVGSPSSTTFAGATTERPETLGSLVRAAQGCRDVALAYQTPFISGKDSLYNEYTQDGVSLAIPPTLLISAMGQVVDVRRCLTMDLKEVGNLLFQVGTTRLELGGSHWAMTRKLTGGDVPRVDLMMAPRLFHLIHSAIEAGLLRSCHDLSEGGLAVALAEMAMAGGFGVESDLTAVPTDSQADSTDANPPGVALVLGVAEPVRRRGGAGLGRPRF